MDKIFDLIKKGDWKGAPQPAPDRQSKLCKPDCPICGRDGWVRLNVPVNHPQFGKLAMCPNVNTDIKMPGFAYRYGLTDKERRQTWDDLLPIPDSNIMQIADQIRDVYRRGFGWVYLHGDFGIGKTLLLQIVTACGLRDGKESAYIRMADIMDMLRDGYKADDYQTRMDWLQDLPILAIDEFDRVAEKAGAGSLSWVGEKRFTLMDHRYISAARGESITIMAGNVHPSKFTFDDGYLWDRIRDGRFQVLHVTGKSIRPGLGA
jgi:DNA replication protein DnaC